MGTQRHDVCDNYRFTLSSALTSTGTTVSVAAGEIAAAISMGLSLPFWLRVYGATEQMECTAWNSTGATLTVSRAANGTSATSHTTGGAGNTYLDVDFVAAQTWEVNTHIDSIDKFLCALRGGGDGVLPSGDMFEVEPTTGGATMAVKVNSGLGFVNNRRVWLDESETSPTITAPSSNPRIDVIQISQYSVVSVLQGTEAASPSAPSLTTGNMALAQILLSTTTTGITSTGITDVRIPL
jgi:hypothetical protein